MEKRHIYLTGAYGRQATVEDWKKGKDFRIMYGPYCSIRDSERMKKDGYTHVILMSSKPLGTFEISL